MIDEYLKLLLHSGKDIFLQEDSSRIILRSIGESISVEVSIPGRAKGSLKISRDKFSSIVSSLSSYDKMVVSNGKILLAGEHSSRSFIAEPSSDFPELSLSQEIFTTEADVSNISSQLKSASSFVSKDQDFFTGYVHFDGSRVFATDRFSMYAASTGRDLGTRFAVSPQQIKAFNAAAIIGLTSRISNFENHWTISGHDFTVRFSKPLVGENTPTFDSLIDKTKTVTRDLKISSAKIFTDFDMLKSCMQSCASVFTSEEYVFAIIESDGSGRMNVSAISHSNGGDEFRSRFDCQSGPFRVKANPRLVDKAISSIRGVKEMAIDSIGNLYFSCGKGRVAMVAPMLEKYVPSPVEI